MNTTYYRRIANPGGNNYIEATFDKKIYDKLATPTSYFNVFNLKGSQEQYLEKITVNSSNIDLDNSSHLLSSNRTLVIENNILKGYQITKQCLVDKGLAGKDIVVRIFINEDVTDLFGLFADLETNYLKKITFNVDTANVTNMAYMFKAALYLVEIEFKKFNSSKVTTFAGMFSYCSSLTNLNLSRVSSNSVESMLETFKDCSSLETLNISNWNTSNVENMSYMFSGCTKLKNIQIGSNFKVSKVTDMTYMFSNCSKLNTIGTTENTIDLSNFSSSSSSEGCNCSYMFSAAGDMNIPITVKLGSLKVTDCSYMFTDSKFTTVNLNIYSSEDIDTSHMFDIDINITTGNNLETVTFSNTNSLKSNDCSYMFYNCINIIDISFYLFDTDACTDMQYMFYNCSSLETLDISGFKTSAVTNFSNMFAYCTNLNKITTNEDNFVLDDSENLSSMFLNCTSLKTLGKEERDNIVYIKNELNIDSCADISYMFESCTAMTSCQLVNFTSSTLTSVGFMLGNCTSLQSLNINGLGGENISLGNSEYVFIFGTKNVNTTDVFGAPSLTNLTINNFNLGYLQDFIRRQTYNDKQIDTENVLIYNCPKLTTCTFTNWTMKNVITLINFFNPIKNSVTTVNLNGLMTTTKLDSLRGMFSECTKLTTIKGLNRNSTTNGSVNFVISGVSNMSYMFNDCSSLTNLDLTGFYVSNACLETAAMFKNCKKLSKIDFTDWNTSNVTDMNSMFQNCISLTELDLSGWNTTNVTNMQNLFYMDQRCKLELITTSTYFKLNDTVDTVDLLSNIFNKELENEKDCGQINPGEGTYYYPDLGKIIIDEDSGAESKLANINDPYFSLEIIPGSTNSFEYGKYQYLPNNWQAQIIKRNYILARYDGSLETSSNYRNFINSNHVEGWDIYVYSESRIADKITYDENNNLITKIEYKIFDELTADEILSNKTGYKDGDDGIYWLKICPNNKIENFENLENLETLENLFKHCKNITYVDFSTFKFYYKVDNNEYKYYTSASHCLYDASNLIQCKMSSFADKETPESSTKILSNTTYMFSGCTLLNKFEANGFVAKNVINAEHMFSGCTSLNDGTQFNSFTFDNLENASYIFNASALENIDIKIASTNYIDFYSAFEGCTSLKTATINFTNANFTYAKDMSRMFYGCGILTSVDFKKSIYVDTGITSIPSNFESLNNQDTRGYGLISVFYDCNNLYEIVFKDSSEINSICTNGYVSCYKMFYRTSVLDNFYIHISRQYITDNLRGVLTTQSMFEESMKSRKNLNNNDYFDNDSLSNYIDCYIESGCLQDTSKMFYDSGITGLTLDIKNHGKGGDSFIDLRINNMSYMFAKCDVLSNIVNNQKGVEEEKYKNHIFDLSWIITYSACNCEGMFEGTSSKLYLYEDNSNNDEGENDRIETFNKKLIEYYDNIYTNSMLIDVILGPIIASNCSNMFYHGDDNKYNNDTGKLPLYIKSIDFNQFNTEQCTSIENMFRGCIFIKELNLESLDLSSVENMDYAFYNYVHIKDQEGGYNKIYNENTPLHFPENININDGLNYIINKLSVIRTYTDFNSTVSCDNLFHKGYEDDYVYTYFDGVFYYKQHAANIEKIIPSEDTNPSIYARIYTDDPQKIYNGDHTYIPDNWMGLPIIESDYFLVYYDSSEIEPKNNKIINTSLDNSDIKIFVVPYSAYNDIDWGINPEFCIDDLYLFGFSIDLVNSENENKKFYINSHWKEIDIDNENAVNQSVYIVLRERSDLSCLFENCTCNLNIIAGPQTIEISSIKGLFKNCIGLGFKHYRQTNSGVEIYGAGNIYTYNLLNNIITDKWNCLEELYAGCSNIISHQDKSYVNEHATEDDLNKLYFLFYPIYGCVWMNDKITSFANLFNGCSNIRNIEFCANIVSTISNVDTITDVSKMFYDCSKLIQINKPSKDSTNAKTFSYISNFESVFENCENLESGADTFFDLADLEKPQPIENAKSMFKNCKKLVFENNEAVGSNWNISKSTTDLSNMFYNCYELKGVDMSSWNICKVSDMSGMFFMEYEEGTIVNLSKVNFVSSDSYLPSPSSVNMVDLFNKEKDIETTDKSYHGYIYPSQTKPTTGSFTYVEGNNVKQFLPDSDINPVLEGDYWNIIGNHEVIPDNWNASYTIAGENGYVLMVYRPEYTTNSGGRIDSFSEKTLLMNSDYYSNSGKFRSHINYTTITTDKGGSPNDDLSKLYEVAASSTYDGTAVTFETLKAYEYQKSNGDTIYMRSSNLTQEQVNKIAVENSNYNLSDLSAMSVTSTVSNPLVKNVYYVNDSIKNSRIIAKVKFNEYLDTFCYHSNDSNNITAGIFDNGDNNDIKLYKIDFSRSRSFWYGNNPEENVDKILNENYEKNDFETYEAKRENYNYSRGLKDCYRAFYNCKLLEEIKFKEESSDYNADPWGMFTKTFTVTSYMFYGCSSLESLNIKCFDTKNVKQMRYMFYGCSNLKTLEFTHAQTTNDSYHYYIGFNTYNNLIFGYMFGECSNLKELNLKGFEFNENIILDGIPESFLSIIVGRNLTTEEDVKKVAYDEHYLTDMFYNCEKLQYLMLPDISRFLYRMFTKYSGTNYDPDKIKYIKILIRSLFNTKINGNAILYCEFDSINFKSQDVEQPLEETSWLFGDQGCTGYSDDDGTILDIMFNMLPDNWTIQPSTNKIFIYIENSATLTPFYVIKYGENIKSINIYNSAFTQINNEFNIYNEPNKGIYTTYYIDYYNTIKNIENKYIYIQKTDSSSIPGLFVEIIFKNYFDKYSENFDTNYLFCYENLSEFINTIASEDDKINITKTSKLNKIYLHSFGIRNDIIENEIPKFNVNYIFHKCVSLTDIFNLDILKYSTNVKNESSNSLKTIIDSDASYAFYECKLITSIDCFNWDTINVTNMDSLFSKCKKLSQIGSEPNTIDLSGWNTSNVKNMSSTFEHIDENEAPYPELNLTGWDTSSVTNMRAMFFGSNFERIEGLSNFKTSEVTDLSYIFRSCSIQNFNDVEGWKFSKVKDMSYAFADAPNQEDDYLTTLDLSGWETSSVTDMYSMFYARTYLKSLNLTGWDTFSVERMSLMFGFCESLSEITNIENFKTDSCQQMMYMFSNCKPLTELDLSKWKTSKVTNMLGMFQSCESLTELDLSGWETSSVTDMGYMFSGCKSLTDDKIDNILSNIEFNSVTNISYMFKDCDAVENITKDFTGINEKLVDATYLFSKDSSKKEKNLSLNNIKKIIENAEYIYHMFSGIKTLDVNNFITYDISHIKSLGNLFYKTELDSPICFSGNFNMILGSDVMINETYDEKHTSVNGIFGKCIHNADINNLSTFDISFGTCYNDEDFNYHDLFGFGEIFYKKDYLHYFIPTYLDGLGTLEYEYRYDHNMYFGGLTNIFGNDIGTSILLGDCFTTELTNSSFFKIYESSSSGSTDKTLICNSENMAKNIQNIYSKLLILYKCIVVNLTLDITSDFSGTDVISSIFTDLLNNPDPNYRYFDNKTYIEEENYSNIPAGRHIITAVFMFPEISEISEDINIFKSSFANQPICDCITHIVISNSIENINTNLSIVSNYLEEVTIYFLPIEGYVVDYNPGILSSLDGNSNDTAININLIYAIENENIEIPSQHGNTTYNIKCNPNAAAKISGYNCYKYIVGELTNY